MRVTTPLRTALAQALPERPFRVELWNGSTLLEVVPVLVEL